MMTTDGESIDLFTTCPTYDGSDASAYVRRVRQVSRWSDEAGCRGILVYTDNSVVDPWLIAQTIIQNTTALAPGRGAVRVYASLYRGQDGQQPELPALQANVPEHGRRRLQKRPGRAERPDAAR